MKNLDLNNYGVQEMNAEEMRVTEGGQVGEAIDYTISLIFGFDWKEKFTKAAIKARAEMPSNWHGSGY